MATSRSRLKWMDAIYILTKLKELKGLELAFPKLIVFKIIWFRKLIEEFKVRATSIANTGLSAPLSSMTLKRRRDLKLPEVKFAPEEVAKIYEALEILEMLKR